MSRRRARIPSVFRHWRGGVQLLLRLCVFGVISGVVYYFINLIGPPAEEPSIVGDDFEQFQAARRAMFIELRRMILLGMIILGGVAVVAMYAAYCLRAPVTWVSRGWNSRRRNTSQQEDSRGSKGGREEQRSNTLVIDPATLEDYVE